ncbi:Transposase IS116/IS110/IS902 family [Cardinium endosymbiont of Sogatella furcifera]|uniref:transposase n=1 Tax=Cardinium endosymbiont of Sogatella furcifera TaxID=650378 RepID=UPI000E0DE1BF|nr:transposase [Cardinium endosymbiont of Sogatella furcifera]AXI24014.1 Transposase IS116/IS110/IS902 family [Cardinium endosymbiont of Sogatella furcifera]AXI24069.1 Transposase IS116/IS110/IS902 family [Cardinium endosymbiont of Sogatella furcifera]AXI24082.1 Transposase IS116/IS110/IS902 family [Cardinium endosymbiont of Sogatella furcifera]AXI24264.1 Transposase IS116/IS110/IS902 family [Cardinium endosymbiont of Sogatella furcifera]AXI24450.1 Transposase IS116/IS110/IS902 family [Cardini
MKANYSYYITTDRLKRQQQRREELVATLSNEKKRLHHSQTNIDKESIERHIDFLEKEIKIIDKALNKTITTDKDLDEKANILETIPGIGKCLATKLVSFLPELGDRSYSSNQLSALVGIAPYAADSGKKQGKRFIRGGRKIPRDALYMAVLAGKKWFLYLKECYDRLVGKYKPKKVAIVACMRKLLELAHKLIQQKRSFVKSIKNEYKMTKKLA